MPDLRPHVACISKLRAPALQLSTEPTTSQQRSPQCTSLLTETPVLIETLKQIATLKLEPCPNRLPKLTLTLCRSPCSMAKRCPLNGPNHRWRRDSLNGGSNYIGRDGYTQRCDRIATNSSICPSHQSILHLNIECIIAIETLDGKEIASLTHKHVQSLSH